MPLHKTVLEGDQPCLLDLLQLQDKSNEQTVDETPAHNPSNKKQQLHPSLMASTIVNVINCY